MADPDKASIILGLIAQAEPVLDKASQIPGGVARIEFTTKELSEDGRLAIPRNQRVRETAELFSSAIRKLGFGEDDIKVISFTDRDGTVQINGTPKIMDSLVKAAATEFKKHSLKTSLEQFNDPTYVARADPEQTKVPQVPNAKASSNSIA